MQQKDATDRFNICQAAGASIEGGEKGNERNNTYSMDHFS